MDQELPLGEPNRDQKSENLFSAENCLLCDNKLDVFAMGACGHKNVCVTCSLRLRLILEDEECPVCRADLDEIVISDDKSLTWDYFNKKLKKKAEEDPEDDTIYYHNATSKQAALQLRTLNCQYPNCPSSKSQFPNRASLQRHLETRHEKTFCKVCLKGRTVFIKEQRLYHINSLRAHIEQGDLGDDKHGEILPHPYNDFIEEFFFDAQTFIDNLNRNHMTCHLCTDHHKHVYYRDYASLETHFSASHSVCPYEICKAKGFVAFRTEDELRAHIEMEHKKGDGKEVKANALLGFIVDDPEEQNNDDAGRGRGRGRGGRGRGGRDGKPSRFEANVIKDTEGIDFGYYFSNKYTHSLVNRRKKFEERKKQQQGGDKGQEDGGGGRGRGRGRGDRGGRGRGRGRGDRGGRYEDSQLSREESNTSEAFDDIKVDSKPLNQVNSPEDKLSVMLNIISEIIKQKLDSKKLSGDYTFQKNQLYQMHSIVSHLDQTRLSKLDLIANFGVSMQVKSEVVNAFSSPSGTKDLVRIFRGVDDMSLLKIHKYLFWADKKLHSHFYTEDRDLISEDLLFDFKSEEDQDQFKKSEALANAKKGSKKEKKEEVQKKPEVRSMIDLEKNKKTITKEDLTFGTKKKKTVDINDDDDFPDLGDDGPGFSIASAKPKGKPQPNYVVKKQTSNIGWGIDTVQSSGQNFQIGGMNVMQAATKDRPLTAQVYGGKKGKKGQAQQRQKQEEEEQRRKAETIVQASEELAAAQNTLNSFDSQPFKSKKKVKQELNEYPVLEGQNEFLEAKKATQKKQEEEKQPEEPTLGNIQAGGGGKRKGRKGGKNAGEQVKIKVGFF